MIKLISKNKDKIVFETDMSESMANAIRRSALEIPVLAVDEVEFYKNDSALFDEILAHRIGLVPIKAEKAMTEPGKCSCEGKGCSKCTAELKIKASGPGIVYSSDLKGKADVVYGQIPLVSLTDGQELELAASARLGKGIEHAKFSPGLVYYRNLAKIEVEKNCAAELEECAKACPLKLLKIENGKLDIKELWRCDLCEACIEECKKLGKNCIKISDSGNLVFFIESWGQIEAKEILIEAVDALQKNLKLVSKEIK